jgi:Dolichyl-phosphate-mannose-protein mannosyltransferase
VPGSAVTDPTELAGHPRERRRLTKRQRDVIALAIIGLVFALPLRGLLRSQGPPMEEGFMLVFPERVLAGDIPNRDFLHLYGPGSLWALAGVFKVFGVSLVTERLFGLLQQLAIAYGIYALARPWGRRVAVFGAVTSALIIVPFGLTALAWVGAVGLALLGLACGLAGRGATDDPVARRWSLLGGVLLGLAVLFRFDLVLAVALAVTALVRGMDRARAHRVLAGVVAGLAPVLIHVALAGPGHVIQGTVIDPVVELRGGRRLPVPPPWSRLDGFLQRAGDLQQLSWPLPTPSTSQQLFLWFFLLAAAVAFLVVAAFLAVRAEPASLRARTLLVVAMFGVGIMPQAVQRVDSAHFAWVGCVPFGFLPVALFDVLRRRTHVARGRLALISGLAVLAVVGLILPTFTVRRYADYALQSFDRHRSAYKIEHDGRVFYYGKKDRADAADLVIADAARIAEPGDTLFVGPSNLRKTPYSDAYLYFMLPDLDPATYYIEMDPGVANAEDSGLSDELAASDIVILSSIWDDWEEPNDSRKEGSREPERVLARDFCLVGDYLGHYQLYRKCQPGTTGTRIPPSDRWLTVVLEP